MTHKKFFPLIITVICVNLIWAFGTDAQTAMTLTSPTFKDGGKLPLSMVSNQRTATDANVCTYLGTGTPDQSPALVWRNVPPSTKSLAVVMYDSTASFTHWGVVNISPTSSGLTAGAGKSSAYQQIANDFGSIGYSGPCPPNGVTPTTHRYIITLYALDKTLSLTGSAHYPANAETLDLALLAAARTGAILASTSISGTYSEAH